MQVEEKKLLDEKEIDSLIEIINDSKNLIFEKSVRDNIQKYKLKIIDLLFDNDYVELIPKLKKIFENDTNYNNNITESLARYIDELPIDSFKWLIDNEHKIFINLLPKITLHRFEILIKSDKFIPIYKLIQSNKNIFDVFEKKILTYLDSTILTTSCYNSISNNIFYNYEKLILIIDLYISHKKIKLNIDATLVHFKIINKLLINNSELKIIMNYTNYYKIKDKELKEYFEKNFVLENFIINTSIEVLNWFFEIVSVLAVFKSINYKIIFKQVCRGGNLESIKLVYNLIQCAGFNIDNMTLQLIMNELISIERWGNKKVYEGIIHEIVNMGIKPRTGLSKYNDYYKSITIINK